MTRYCNGISYRTRMLVSKSICVHTNIGTPTENRKRFAVCKHPVFVKIIIIMLAGTERLPGTCHTADIDIMCCSTKINSNKYRNERKKSPEDACTRTRRRRTVTERTFLYGSRTKPREVKKKRQGQVIRRFMILYTHHSRPASTSYIMQRLPIYIDRACTDL